MSSNGPRILTLDIETSPHKGWFWGLYNQNIALSQVEEFTRVICFAAKWRDQKKVQWFSEFHHGHDGMVLEAFDLLNEADVVVTYNGDKFDLPHLNREFDEACLGRPAPYHSVDLYKAGKKHKRFASHKLAHILERLSLESKMQNSGFDLWKRCLAGDPKAWAEMRRYNKQDVVATEDLYLDWLPWLDGHPALTLYVDDTAPLCPRCLKPELERRGYATTKLGKYQRYQCQACGTWSRGARRVEGVDVR